MQSKFIFVGSLRDRLRRARVMGPERAVIAAEAGTDPGAAGDFEAYCGVGSCEELTHFVTRTWYSARGSLRGPFHTYYPVPRAVGAAIGPPLDAIVASPVAFGPAEL